MATGLTVFWEPRIGVKQLAFVLLVFGLTSRFASFLRSGCASGSRRDAAQRCCMCMKLAFCLSFGEPRIGVKQLTFSIGFRFDIALC